MSFYKTKILFDRRPKYNCRKKTYFNKPKLPVTLKSQDLYLSLQMPILNYQTSTSLFSGEVYLLMRRLWVCMRSVPAKSAPLAISKNPTKSIFLTLL